MLWMVRWAGSFPVFVKEAKGARFTDVDGNSYIDFCLGDTGAMTGHGPDATVAAITEQITMTNCRARRHLRGANASTSTDTIAAPKMMRMGAIAE